MHDLAKFAQTWRESLDKKKRCASVYSSYWTFVRDWLKNIIHWLNDFTCGQYHFEPAIHCYALQEHGIVWGFKDRLFLALLYRIIKPTFQAIIPKACVHLNGPSQGSVQATQQIKAALGSGPFNYFMRLDIKGHYASIQHDILFKQIKDTFNDPRLILYFDQIIHHTVYDAGNYTTPTQSIPMRSSLSPFFDALYLKPLDEAFSNRDNVFYVRTMNDIFILFKTKRQFLRARKRIFGILRQLKLVISPNKSSMGKLEGKALHFLRSEISD